MYIEDTICEAIKEVIERYFVCDGSYYTFNCYNRFDFQSSYELGIEVFNRDSVLNLVVYVVDFVDEVELEFSYVTEGGKEFITSLQL